MPGKTDSELLALGKKVEAQNEKAKLTGKARNAATQRLVAAHKPEYEAFLAEEKKKARV